MGEEEEMSDENVEGAFQSSPGGRDAGEEDDARADEWSGEEEWDTETDEEEKEAAGLPPRYRGRMKALVRHGNILRDVLKENRKMQV